MCVLILLQGLGKNIVYYESRNRDLKMKLMNEGRCDERLKSRYLHESHTLGSTTKKTRNT
jgi:hypothetical protein